MAKTLLFRHTLTSQDALVDDSSSQFVFHSDTAVDYANVLPVINHVSAFWHNAGTGGLLPIAHYISAVMSRGANQEITEVYDITGHLDGTPHGSPVVIDLRNFGPAASGNGLPEGVAATISFQSSYGTDVEFGTGTRPRARDRNRVYVGPLTDAALTHDGTTSRTKFAAQFVTDCLAAIFDLSGDVTAGGETWVLQQWSRRNAAIKLPTNAWMDDRPDYQRRRADPSPGTRVSRALQSV